MMNFTESTLRICIFSQEEDLVRKDVVNRFIKYATKSTRLC